VPFMRNLTSCLPCICNASLVTPIGKTLVALTSLLDIPGSMSDTLENVSVINSLSEPEMRSRTVATPINSSMFT
jgi:hypothetical protein